MSMTPEEAKKYHVESLNLTDRIIEFVQKETRFPPVVVHSLLMAAGSLIAQSAKERHHLGPAIRVAQFEIEMVAKATQKEMDR